MVREIDVMHLGRDRVIAAHELRGLIVDPGPASALDNWIDELEVEPRALLLTHIHLDHAGRHRRARAPLSGAARLRQRGRRAAPDRSLEAARERRRASTASENMERLWGEVAPVPEERT